MEWIVVIETWFLVRPFWVTFSIALGLFSVGYAIGYLWLIIKLCYTDGRGASRRTPNHPQVVQGVVPWLLKGLRRGLPTRHPTKTKRS